MTDVYAKMGIPLPPNPDEDKDVEPTEEDCKADPDELDGISKWREREEAERDQHLRLECLKLVDTRHIQARRIPQEAERLVHYVKNGLEKSVGTHTILCGVCTDNWSSEDQESVDDWFKGHVQTAHPDMYTKLFGHES